MVCIVTGDSHSGALACEETKLTCTAFAVLLLDSHHHHRNLIIYRELLQPAINPLHNEQINSAPALA